MDSLCLFSFFSINYYTIQVVDFSGIRTRILGKKVEYTDHLTQHHGPEIKHFDWMVQIMRRSTIFFKLEKLNCIEILDYITDSCVETQLEAV